MTTTTIDIDKLDITDEKQRLLAWCLGADLEWYKDGGLRQWHGIKSFVDLSSGLNRKFRRKPDIRTIEIPKCITEVPADDTECWKIAMNMKCGYEMWQWSGDDFDLRSLANGQYFHSEDDVKAVIAAMRGEK